jgi:hypothetical protein
MPLRGGSCHFRHTYSKFKLLFNVALIEEFVHILECVTVPSPFSIDVLAGYSLSIISNSKKNNEEILITNDKDMPKGRNVLLKHYKGKK